MMNLEGRLTLVTGASRGIGRVTARRLAEAGATVLAAARGDHAQDTVNEITKSGGRGEVVSLDVSDPENVEQVLKEVIARHGGIEILVNNAGITRDQLMLRMKQDDWEAVVSTNLTGAFTCTRVVLRSMLKGRFGRIINISSVVGQMGNVGQTNYAASKAGLIGFTKSLAREVAPRGITANVIAPGLIETDMTQALTEDMRGEWESRVPLGRLGSPNDVAAAVCFLASDEASYITGQVLSVNGGIYM